MLVHGEGDVQGEPIRFEPWERQIIYRLYEYDPVTLERVVRRALLVMPKGCAKTELVAAICLAELAGPVMPTADGKGTLRRSPNIPFAAGSWDQAEKLFGAAKDMATVGPDEAHPPPLAAHVEAFDTEILLRGRKGRLFRVAAVAGTNDGGLPTCFGADEIHEWTGNKARVHLVVTNSLEKRANCLELNISTPDAADPESLFGKLYAAGRKVATGEVVDPSFLFVHYSAADHWDVADPEQLRSAIAEATPAGWRDVERVARKLEVDRIPEHEFRRYFLAQLRRPEGQWLPPNAWETLADPQPAPADGAEVALFFDGSYNGDSTALVGCVPGDLPYVFVVDAWERPADAEEWLVPREAVKARVKECFTRWRCRMGVDPPGWHAEVEVWEETYGEAVIRFETNVRRRMSAACSRFYTAVVGGLLSHDGDPRLARHLRGAVVKETTDGAYITKSGRHGPKIDLAVAAVGALEIASLPEAMPPPATARIPESDSDFWRPRSRLTI